MITNFWYPNETNGGLHHAAMLSLYNRNNREIRLSLQREQKLEIIVDLETRQEKHESKITESWVRWQSLVEERFAALALIRDHLIRQRLAPSADIKPPIGTSLEGYDFSDLVVGTSTIQPRRTKMLGSAGDWPKWAHDSDATVLFGHGYGELILPSVQDKACGQSTSCPPEHDYLAAPLSLLLQPHKTTMAKRTNCFALGKSIIWENPAHAFPSPCECALRKKKGDCETWISRLTSKTGILNRSGPELTPEALLERYPRGAVLFGHRLQRLQKWRKHSNQEHRELKAQLVPQRPLNQMPPPERLRESASPSPSSTASMGLDSGIGMSSSSRSNKEPVHAFSDSQLSPDLQQTDRKQLEPSFRGRTTDGIDVVTRFHRAKLSFRSPWDSTHVSDSDDDV
jgi:hypothetical protein